MHMLLLLLATTLVRCLDLNNNLKNNLTSDLDICRTGSPWYYLGHVHWSRSWVRVQHHRKTGSSMDATAVKWLESESDVGKTMSQCL